jgi:battenin
VGLFCGLGDCTLLGFMKIYPALVVSGYASGTGAAGVFGALYYLMMNGLFELGGLAIFMILMPLNIGYILLFMILVKKRKRVAGTETGTGGEEDSQENAEFSCGALRNTFQKVGVFIVNLTMVYWLEYVCLNSWADRTWRTGVYTTNWIETNSYAVLSLTYQVGVFLSRTSVQFFRFKWVTVLTAIQFVNFVLWTIAAYYPGTQFLPMWTQIVLIFWVGLMGGCSYSNCMYFVLNSEKLDKKEKEVTINIGSMFYDTGIFLAGVSSLIISNFMIKSD